MILVFCFRLIGNILVNAWIDIVIEAKKAWGYLKPVLLRWHEKASEGIRRLSLFVRKAMAYTDREFEDFLKASAEGYRKDKEIFAAEKKEAKLYEKLNKVLDEGLKHEERETYLTEEYLLNLLPVFAASVASWWFFGVAGRYTELTQTMKSISTDIIITNKNLAFISAMAAIGLAVYAAAEIPVMIHRFYLLKRYGKTKISFFSQPARVMLAIYLAALCFLAKDFIREMFELTTASKISYAASAALPFLGFMFLLGAVIKMVTFVDRLEDHASKKS